MQDIFLLHCMFDIVVLIFSSITACREVTKLVHILPKSSTYKYTSPFYSFLKGPCHAFPVITRPLVCYEGFYACKRCAESQTLKVHPVASKTITQYAPERLFSFSWVQ